jgi:DNA replication and repair protein RecF
LLKFGAGRRPSSSQGQVDLRTLEVWDSHLAAAGGELLAGRLDLVDSLRPLIDKAYQSVSEAGFASSGPATVDYRSSVGEDVPLVADKDLLAAAMLERMAIERKAELDRGLSLVGPHRDELVLKLGPLPARGYASHGESWSFALALRLASYDLLRAESDAGGEPVLVLDDVFAELDDHRRARLAGMVAGAEQVLVTAAVPGDVPEGLAGARVDVMGSEVRRIR